jgi:hypothetical protein
MWTGKAKRTSYGAYPSPDKSEPARYVTTAVAPVNTWCLRLTMIDE